jgi:tripartite-type tricarboxylate transporter receptor subunit TctC
LVWSNEGWPPAVKTVPPQLGRGARSAATHRLTRPRKMSTNRFEGVEAPLIRRAVIVPFPAGGSNVIGRIMIERMRVPLGQRIVIENAGGAYESIGICRAARARPDGLTH